MNKILKKYGDIIMGWDTEVGIGENPDEVFYYVWLKKPWVMEVGGKLSDVTDGFDTLKNVMKCLKTARKDIDVWDKL